MVVLKVVSWDVQMVVQRVGQLVDEWVATKVSEKVFCSAVKLDVA